MKVCVCTGHAGRLRHSAQAKFAGPNLRLADTSDKGQREGSRKLFKNFVFIPRAQLFESLGPRDAFPNADANTVATGNCSLETTVAS